MRSNSNLDDTTRVLSRCVRCAGLGDLVQDGYRPYRALVSTVDRSQKRSRMQNGGQERSFEGYWWLPSDPDRQIAGILSEEPSGGSYLHLLGCFTEGPRHPDNEFYPVICGSAAGAGRVLLAKCLLSNWSDAGDRTQSYFSTDYKPLIAYLGLPTAHHHDAESALAEVIVHFSSLPIWWDESGFERPSQSDGTVSVYHGQVADLILDFPDFQVTFANRRSMAFGTHGLTLEEKCSIVIRAADQPKSLDDWLSCAIQPIQEFLTFAVGARALLNDVDGILPRTELPSDEMLFPVRILFDRFLGSAETARSIPFPIEQVLPYYRTRDRLHDIVGRWLNLYALIDPAIHIYSLSRDVRHRYAYPEVAFLNAVQALESYQDARMPNTVMERREYNQIAKLIKRALSGNQHTGRVLQQLQRVQFNTQREQFEALFEATDPLAAPFVPDRTSFIGKVVSTRNYYTHLNPKLKERILGRKEMIDATEILWILFEMLLLMELGFSHQDALTMMKSSRAYHRVGKSRVVE